MELLVYLDEDDKNAWYEITEMYNKVLKDQTLATELKNKTAMFWHLMIEKYPVLRNKNLNVNQVNGTISCWTSVSELRR